MSIVVREGAPPKGRQSREVFALSSLDLLLVAVNLNLPQPRPVTDVRLGNRLVCYFENSLALPHETMSSVSDKGNLRSTENISLRSIGIRVMLEEMYNSIDCQRS